MCLTRGGKTAEKVIQRLEQSLKQALLL